MKIFMNRIIYILLVITVKSGSHMLPIYICDVATGTASATSQTNENMHCWQLEPSQSFTAGMPAKLN